jgi:hypothetical protein
MFDKYEWIVVSKDRDNDVKKMRRKIRSHAMKATAALRKRSGEGAKQKHEQYPDPPDVTSAAPDPPDALQDLVLGRGSNSSNYRKLEHAVLDSDDSLTCASSIGSPMPLSGLELLTAETGLNVLDLSALTAIHIGQRASLFLTKQPSCLGRLISRRRLSYLNYVPARYGHIDCLDNAIRCVTVKAKRVLAGYELRDNSIELSLYGKALHSLRSAVSDFDGRGQISDVLCTIQILSLFDVSYIVGY